MIHLVALIQEKSITYMYYDIWCTYKPIWQNVWITQHKQTKCLSIYIKIKAPYPIYISFIRAYKSCRYTFWSIKVYTKNIYIHWSTIVIYIYVKRQKSHTKCPLKPLLGRSTCVTPSLLLRAPALFYYSHPFKYAFKNGRSTT